MIARNEIYDISGARRVWTESSMTLYSMLII